MTFTDTHSHLYLSDYDQDRAEAMRRAIDAGVSRLILPNVDAASIAPMRAMHDLWPDNTRMAIGLHPTEIGPDGTALQAVLDELVSRPDDYVALGEIGMDLYWDKSDCDRQMQYFEKQLQHAVQFNKPVIIHNREALPQSLEVLQPYNGRVRGVFHCFGGSPDDVEAIRRIAGDFYFGIGGVLTFKNSKLDKTVPSIGLDRIVLETDCPWLAPVPNRGKRNESAYVPLIAAKLADILEKDIDEVAAATSSNSMSLFGF